MPAMRSTLTRFLLLTLLAPGGASALPPGVTQGASVEGITEYTLANGLKVLLFPDPGAAKTTVNVTYLVGSRQENYGETGMAHLLEHMTFKGSPTSGNFWDEMNKRGMRFNGSTWYDRTNYHETFNASDADLEWALQMEAQRMTDSAIAKKDLDTEMTVVRNEMERGENDPWRIMIQRMISSSYEWHNYGKETIGARSDVEGVDIGHLRAFYKLYYQPDNAVLVVAGKFNPEETLGWIAKYFGKIPKPARTLPRLYTEEPVQDGERTVTVRRVGDAQLLGIAYHTVRGADPDFVAVDALADIMTIQPAGRLYKALVEARKAAAVDSWAADLHDPGFVAFFAQVPVSESLDTAKQAMIATLDGVRTDPITAAEVDRVRAKALRDFDETLADPTRLGVRLSESIAAGDWRLFFLQRDEWRKVTAADVQRVAEAYIKPSNRTIAMFVPDAKPDRAPTPPAVDLAAMLTGYKGDPAASAGEAFDATPANLDARAQRFTLANGMNVVLLPKKTRGETVKFRLQLHQGDEKSLFGTMPRGELMAAMLQRGTAKHSRQEIEDTLDKLRAKLSIQGGETSATASGETVRQHLDGTLELLADVLREPSFPPAEFETLKRETITALDEKRADPESVGQRALDRLGNPYPLGDVRYTPTLDEEIKMIEATNVAAVKSFYDRFTGGAHAELAIVGDFDPAAVKAETEKLFGDWKSPAPFTRVPEPLVAKPAKTLLLETPDKANAALFGEVALALNDESADYPALSVAAFILGDTGSSRLWKRIREKEGLSYGVYAWLQPSLFEPNTPLNVEAIFAPENRERLATAFGEEMSNAVNNGFTDAEVALAKSSLRKRRQLQRTQDATLAAQLVQQAYRGRTFAFTGKIDAAIAAVTTADVNAALRKYVKPDAFALVYAGDFAKAAKAKQAANR
jgi:zinc protease